MKHQNIITLVLVVALLGILAYISNQRDQLETKVKTMSVTVDSLSRRCDSLDAELFSSDLTLSRYETAYGIFIKRNPHAAMQYGNIISDETE